MYIFMTAVGSWNCITLDMQLKIDSCFRGC